MKALVLVILTNLVLFEPGTCQQLFQSEIIGKWDVAKVTENDTDITNSIDNNAQRWIEFINNDQYASDGYPFGRYDGEYKLNEASGLLILKSASSGAKGMQWKVRYDGEYLILKGTGQLQLYTFFLRKSF